MVCVLEIVSKPLRSVILVAALAPGPGEGDGAGTPQHAVILVTPVIPAIGCDDMGEGNPEEQRQPPVIFPLHLNGGSVGV